MAGEIKSLMQAARHGMLLTVSCVPCQREAHFLATDVAKFMNPGSPLHALPFKCNKCGKRGREIVASEIDRDRKPSIMVWRPTRLT
jgi:NAD-dependent SIR2 family protein deacetylase